MKENEEEEEMCEFGKNSTKEMKRGKDERNDVHLFVFSDDLKKEKKRKTVLVCQCRSLH